MGYETRIFVGEPSSYTVATDGNKKWFQVFSMMNLSKVGGLLVPDDIINVGQEIFIFGSDGDTKIDKDCYGATLRAIHIHYVIDALKEINARENYTRTRWAYDMLVSMSKKRRGFHGMVATHCVLFGY